MARFHPRVHEYVAFGELIAPYIEFADFGHVIKIQS